MLAVLLVANAIVIAVVIFTDVFDADQASPTTDRPIAGVPERAIVRPPAEQRVNVPPAVGSPAPKPAEEIAATDSRSTPIMSSVATPPPVEAVREPIVPPVVQESAILPSMEELQLSGQLSLIKPLYVDIHVYADDRAKRFVFINMQKYREGERLGEGPVVQEITRAGVVLSHQGNEFTLNRE